MLKIFPLIWLIISPNLFATTDPTEVDVKILAVYMSKDPYCGSPIEVFTTSEPGFVDFLGGPTVGQLDNSKYLYDGTYQCVIVKMSETIRFVPLIGSGVCVAGNRFESDVCGAGVVTTGIDGTATTCTASTGDSVYLYLSTASTAASFTASTNPFSPPTVSTPTNGLPLASGISISGSSNLKLVVNLFGKIEVINGTCAINNPAISFGPYP